MGRRITNKAEAEQVAVATLKYHRCSAQKARLVVDQIRGRRVNDALALLRFSPKAASSAIEKLVKSAVANAGRAGERKVDVDALYVGEAQVGPGPSFKRFRGRAFGRAFPVLHRSCHITVKLMAPPGAVRAAGGRRTKAASQGKAAEAPQG